MSPKLHTPKTLQLSPSSSPSPTLMTDIIWPWGNLVTVWCFEAHLFLSPIFVCLSHFCTDQKPDVASTQPSWPCLTRVPGAAYLFQERERSHIDRQTQTHRGIDVQTDADLQTHTQTDTHTEMDTDMYWWTHTETNRHRHTDTYREIQTHAQKAETPRKRDHSGPREASEGNSLLSCVSFRSPPLAHQVVTHSRGSFVLDHSLLLGILPHFHYSNWAENVCFFSLTARPQVHGISLNHPHSLLLSQTSASLWTQKQISPSKLLSCERDTSMRTIIFRTTKWTAREGLAPCFLPRSQLTALLWERHVVLGNGSPPENTLSPSATLL